MKSKFDVDIKGSIGTYTIEDGKVLPFDKEVVKNISVLEGMIGEIESITFKFK